MSRPYVIPFGKHRGEPIKKVPTKYLEWLEEEKLLNGANTSDKLMQEIKLELSIRSKERGVK